MLRFRARGTPSEPWKPVATLVTDGIFGRMRNPMYVGGILFLAGLSIALASSWMLVMTILSALVLHFGVVKREERYLDRQIRRALSALHGGRAALRLAGLIARMDVRQ